MKTFNEYLNNNDDITKELTESIQSEELTEEQPVLLKGAKNLRTATMESTDSVQRLKNLLKEELIFKGYNLNNLVEPTIHNSK